MGCFYDVVCQRIRRKIRVWERKITLSGRSILEDFRFSAISVCKKGSEEEGYLKIINC
jgi:hypothetical protein